MELMPYKKKVIVSSLNMTKVLLELENLIEHRRFFLNMGFCNTSKPFKGYIKGSYIKIKMTHMNTKLGSFSPPIIVGKIENIEDKTKISITMRLCSYEIFFFGLLIGWVVMICSAGCYYGLMSVPILLMVYMVIVFNYYSKKSIEILLKHFNSTN